MVVQYDRWIFEHKKNENVKVFKSFIIQEAEFQMAASETVHGLYLKKESYKNKHGGSYFGAEEQEDDALFVVWIILCGPAMDLKRCL